MTYDVVVVGGGIHGVGVAQAAAAEGYSVLLVEQSTLAHGTSSRSSKLIHGGLRYLESGQINLVRECLYERQLLVKNAPDIVNLVPFFLPVYRNTSRRPLTIRAGLTMYGALTGFHKSAKYQLLGRSHWDELDGLKTEGLQKVFQYWDAQTDDVLLTRAVMNSALTLGAEMMQGTTLVSGQQADSLWTLQLKRGEEELEVQTVVVVNAGGPWVNRVLERLTPVPAPRAVSLVKGTHIVFEHHLNKGVYYLEAPQDRRAVFVMPWKGGMMIGTTEQEYTGDPEQVEPSGEEINYLLETYHHYFDNGSVSRESMKNAFAGLRVLPAAEGEAFSRPRETVLHCDDEKRPSLLSIYGGKLTAYRATAEQVMIKLKRNLPQKNMVADTRTMKLYLPS